MFVFCHGSSIDCVMSEETDRLSIDKILRVSKIIDNFDAISFVVDTH